MNTEDRVRRAMHYEGDTGGPDGLDPAAWESIQRRIARRRRRLPGLLRRLWFVLPVIVLAALSIPVIESLAPGGRPTQVAVTPDPSGGPTQTLAVRPCSHLSEPPGAGSGTVTPSKVTVALSPGLTLAAYGADGVVAVGPRGWRCQVRPGNEGTSVVIYPSEEGSPLEGPLHVTGTVEAIIAQISSPGLISAEQTCGFLHPAAVALGPAADATPCSRSTTDGSPPSLSAPQSPWETRIENQAGSAGTGLFSGGTNPTVTTIFFLPTNEAGGELSCTLPPSDTHLCQLAMDSFSAQYVHLTAVPGLAAQTPTERAVGIYSAVLSLVAHPLEPWLTRYVQASEAGPGQPLFATSTVNASGIGPSTSLPPMPLAVQQGLVASLSNLNLHFTTDPDSLYVALPPNAVLICEGQQLPRLQLPNDVDVISLGQIPAGATTVVIRATWLAESGRYPEQTYTVVRTRSGWVAAGGLSVTEGC